MEEQNKKSYGWLFAIIVLIVIIIAGSFIIKAIIGRTTGNTDGELKLLSRSATNNDITITKNNDFSLSIRCYITPNEDINDLELTFRFLDSNSKVKTTKTKSVGNVTENTKYTITFSLTEFSFTEIFTINSYSVNVTGGTVSYLG